MAYSLICNNSNIANIFLPTHRLYSVNNFNLSYYGAELTSLLAFSNIPTSMSWLFSASITNLSHIIRLYNNSVSHLNGSSDLRGLSFINRSRSAALSRAGDSLIPLCFDALLVDESRSAASRFRSIYFMRCNLKTPNIGEVSFVSAFGPLFEWNVPVFLMASRQCTLSPFPPLATPLLIGLC